MLSKVNLFKPNLKLADNQKHPSGIKVIKYIEDLDKILCLDQVSEFLYLYKNNGKLWKKLNVNKKKQVKDSKILWVDWSSKEHRVGACLHDKTLVFWDWKDGYEHSFSYNGNVHTHIWYINYCNIWITLDSTYTFYKWDIYNETAKKFPSIHTQAITSLLEIESLSVVVVSSLDKRVVLWEVNKGIIIGNITLPRISIHTLVYSKDFEVMFSAGYEAEICIWTFNKSIDMTLSKKVLGHNSQVTALQVIDSQRILLSADELGFIKSWSITSLFCLQSFHFESRIPLSKIICITKERFIIVGSRFYFFDFIRDNELENINKKTKEIVVDIEYSNSIIYIATPKDIHSIDIKTGRCIKIYSGIVNNCEEILKLALIPNDRKLVIATTSGNIHYASLLTGLTEKIIKGTESIIELTYSNNLLMTIRKHSVIAATYKYNIRETHGANIKLEVATISEQLDMFAAITSDNLVYVWDYSTFKLLGTLSNKLSDVFALKFINPLMVLGTLHYQASMILWSLSKVVDSFALYKAIGSISIHELTIVVIDVGDDCRVYLGTEEGMLVMVQLNKELLGCESFKGTKDFAVKGFCKRKVPAYSSLFSEPLAEMNKDNINKLDIEKHVLKIKAHNESINSIKVLKVNEQELIVTKGNSQQIKIWTYSHSLELVADFNIDNALPSYWKIVAQSTSERYTQILRAATCLYQLDKNTFNSLITEYRDKVFATEITFTDIKKSLKYAKSKKDKEIELEMISFKRLGKEKKRLRNKQLNVQVLEKIISHSRGLRKNVSQGKSLKRVLSKEYILRSKSKEEFHTASLPAINHLKVSRRKVKDWIEYAREKTKRSELPLVLSKSDNKDSRSPSRKQILDLMLRKRKKSMAFRYDPYFKFFICNK